MTEDTKEYKPAADVGAQRVARVYAEALLNSAQKADQAEGILDELDSLIRDIFPANPKFADLLSSAAVGRKARTEILHKVFENRASARFFNFLLVLNDHERLDLLPTILAAFRELNDQRAHRVRVRVQSAVPLPDDQKEHLQQIIREKMHLEPILETQVDAGLLGGIRVRVGDWLYDASVRTQLETIRTQIIARSSHEIQSRRDRFCIAE